MREIFLILDEVETGPMSVHDVLVCVEEGRAHAETQYWESGLEAWETLTSLLPGLAAEAESGGDVEIASNPQCRVEDGVKTVPDHPQLVRPPAPLGGSIAPSAAVSESALRVQALRDSRRERERGGSLLLMAWFFGMIAAGAACFHFIPLGRIAMAIAGLVGVILAIIALFNGRVLGGIIALLAASIIPFGVFTVAKAKDLRPSVFTNIEKAKVEKKAAQPGFKDVKLDVVGDVRRLSVVVQTLSSGSPEKLQVIVSWLGEEDRVITTTNVPLAGGVAIPPGESVKFTVDAPADPAILSFRTKIAPLK